MTGRRSVDVGVAVLVATLLVGAVAAGCTSKSPASGMAPASPVPSIAVVPSPVVSSPVVSSPVVSSAVPSVGPAVVSSPAPPVTSAVVPSVTTRTSPVPTLTTPPAVAPILGTAYVDVAVATLWHSPSSPRVVDQPELTRPAAVRTWLSAMSTAQRRALNGRVDSQLLLGERVIVDKRQGTWAHVVVPDQPTPPDARGYPGWIPVAQLTFRAPTAGARDIVVTRPIAWLYAMDGTTRVVEVSMATRLPAVSSDATWVHSELPDGRAVQLHIGDGVVVAAGSAALPATAADVVRTAQLFAGLPYLWGGTSGFGFDCSGFTHLVLAMRGLTIPRDADAQARAGTAVARADLRPGDLVFFATNGLVHHVGIYLGNNTMLSSLETGDPVEVSSLAAQPFASEYAGARRFM